MGQQQSKDELLFQQVNYGNVEGIKALRTEGAGLEWIDREGKTALIAACMSSNLYNVAKTLIELGANVNAYRPGRHAGTPLHHAAKRGLDQTVKLLLTYGANALVMNDDCQTPLDVARSKGYTNVVRTIENHICLFSGWLREFYGPDFLDLFAPQLLSRRVWVVVLPVGSRNLNKPFKLELAIYSSVQDARPRTLIALWKANLEEPNFSHADPAAIISDIPNIPIPRRGRRRRGALSSRVARCDPRGVRQARVKLAAATETDKQQLQRFCNACKGIPQVIHQNFPFVPQAPPMPAPATSSTEDIELAMAINASIQSAAESRPPYASSLISEASTSSATPAPVKESTSCSQTLETGSTSNHAQNIENQDNIPSTVQMPPEIPVPTSLPSAPPVEDLMVDDGPIHYPSIDFSPIDFSIPAVENSSATAMKDEKKGDSGDSSSSCVICLDAPVEGACIPCGHMAGCMSCLSEIKSKKWGCPVCRAKIDQIIRLYAV